MLVGVRPEVVPLVEDSPDDLAVLRLAQEIACEEEGALDAAELEGVEDRKAALAEIAKGTFSEGDGARFKPLLDGIYQSDYFMLAADFGDYLARQRDVGAAYRDKRRWFRSAALNTASVG